MLSLVFIKKSVGSSTRQNQYSKLSFFWLSNDAITTLPIAVKLPSDVHWSSSLLVNEFFFLAESGSRQQLYSQTRFLMDNSKV